MHLVIRRRRGVADDGVRAECLRQVVELFHLPLIARLLDLDDPRSGRLGIGHTVAVAFGPEIAIIWEQAQRKLTLTAGADVLRQRLLT